MSRKAPRKTSPCRVCLIIRAFLVIAAILMGLMAFQPEAAVVLARLMPSPAVIGALFGLLAVAVFVVKFIRWRRDP